jgi:hypothetical protein
MQNADSCSSLQARAHERKAPAHCRRRTQPSRHITMHMSSTTTAGHCQAVSDAILSTVQRNLHQHERNSNSETQQRCARTGPPHTTASHSSRSVGALTHPSSVVPPSVLGAGTSAHCCTLRAPQLHTSPALEHAAVLVAVLVLGPCCFLCLLTGAITRSRSTLPVHAGTRPDRVRSKPRKVLCSHREHSNSQRGSSSRRGWC